MSVWKSKLDARDYDKLIWKMSLQDLKKTSEIKLGVS